MIVAITPFWEGFGIGTVIALACLVVVLLWLLYFYRWSQR